jgi:excinuclease ABC subunit B
MQVFKVETELIPRGDQPKAIELLAQGVKKGLKFQTLLGITGSGKTATIAWTIERVQKPTLVLAPNKSLAAQFASELKSFLKHNAVEFFVSYYDYYQPEAYVPTTDTYIEKDASINDEIERLRHSATTSLLTRRDTVVVASVSAIYALGPPSAYSKEVLRLSVGNEIPQRKLAESLIEMRYERNDYELKRASFRVKGEVVDIHPADDDTICRLVFFDEEIESIYKIDPLTGEIHSKPKEILIFPATHYVADEKTLNKAIEEIQKDLNRRIKYFEKQNKLLEAQRLKMRTEQDIRSIKEFGYCKGIENYSRYLDGRNPGETPYCLLDYFPEDFLVVIDESHVSIPQLHGQYEGDHSRKQTLVDYGFRLPSALDNRPLKFEEFLAKAPQIIMVSATPSDWELEVSSQVVEIIVRPTGLVDPEVEIKKTENQIDDLIAQIREVVKKKSRVLVTTLTKKTAEDLTEYLSEIGIKARYLHSDIDTIERIEILRDLRLGNIDVLIGVNLLREGLDLPEVELVAILDADKEGFLRSKTSIIQTMGRAARNVNGRVILYADRVTKAMSQAVKETQRRRKIQLEYNKAHNINPETIRKEVNDILNMISVEGINQRKKKSTKQKLRCASEFEDIITEIKNKQQRDSVESLMQLYLKIEHAMKQAAKELKFELAARLRDELFELKKEISDLKEFVF